ncbi:cysteine protease ATG4 Ecym_6474 [Eremothecium cymbalariae DBVPG|uniref:Cysteine protease n=1 Tax=Eremothecium cymbalariae (strain CBS 270.75 / DBVPG 7215 / KCTC 17166 / NRRL Y-17582) TaxID=931890 RepID=G8JUR5_ERECY|nr:hypothetical protein Ecym_6474 [Eremothecium cymbalariae DBVPG\
MDLIQRVSQSFWGLENSDRNNQLVVLGAKYDPISSGWEEQNQDNFGSLFQHMFTRPEPWNPEFLKDVNSRLHFTYRTRFAPIPRHIDGPSPMRISILLRDNPLNVIENVLNNLDCFQTDIGWGCMIRTGQSLLANALQLANLGRDFRISGSDSDINEVEMKIIRWFEDNPKHPFSLHKFVQEGYKLSGKKPGEWFGPSAISRSIRSLVMKFPGSGIDHCIISTDSADVYLDEIDPLFRANPKANVLLLLGVRLGVDFTNEYYWDDIKNILSSSQSVGISGGRPSSSLYFFGYQGDYLFYLDPHKVQLNLALYESDEERFHSVHPQTFNKIHLSAIDPSMLLGFLLTGEDDWLSWKTTVLGSKIIHLSDSKPVDIMLDNEVERMLIGERKTAEQRKDLTSDLEIGDYVDVGSLVQSADSYKNKEADDEYQDVKCKNQKIVVVGESNSSGAPDVEVEKVLVEKETIPVRGK